MMYKFRKLLLLLGAFFCAFAAHGSNKDVQAWPTQTIKIVVGFPAGSSPDLSARALAEPLSKH